MKLSIIIVNYNTRGLLKECLLSIRRNPPSAPYEVLVVDNASSDGSRDMVAMDFPEVGILTNDSNIGFARANNEGMKSSDGEYILLLNSDAELKTGTADTMLDYMDKNLSVGVLGPKLVSPTGDIIQMSWGWYPSIFKELIQKILAPRYISRYKLIKKAAEILVSRDRDVELVYGASILVRRAILNKTGMLDENLFLYFEEPDFCLRVKKAGYTIRYLSGASVIHKHGRTMRKIGDRAQLVYRESQIYYYNKNQRRIQRILLKYFLTVKFAALKIAHRSKTHLADTVITMAKERIK